MDVSIITVTWNSEQFIVDQLASVFNSVGPISYEIFVVDNASSDHTVAQVREQFPNVHLFANTENLGFAKANNQAIAQSTGRYVLLLNPDMRIFPDTLAKMVAWMDAHPAAAVAGAHLVTQAGETLPHVRHFPTVWNQAAILLKLPHVIPSILSSYLMNKFDYTQEASVDSVRGSFFMIRRETLQKLGGIDERYFIWMEDADYCKQVVAAGMQVMYTPTVTVVDYVGRSFALVAGYRKQRFFTRSLVTYFKKWHPRWQSFLLQALVPFALGIAWLAERLRVRSRAKT